MTLTLFKIAFFLNLFLLVAANGQREGYKDFDEEIKCSDGTVGAVEHIQAYSVEPFQVAIYKVDCSPTRSWHNSTTNSTSSIERRAPDVVNLCSSTCSTQCYGGTGSPTKSDCDAMANNLASRGQTHTVGGAQKLVASSGTCLFRFTNEQGYQQVQWCDSTWASQSRSMEGQCLPQTPGAYCTSSNYMLDVCLNPDAPAPTASPIPVYPLPSPVRSSTTPQSTISNADSASPSPTSIISSSTVATTGTQSRTNSTESVPTGAGIPSANLPGVSSVVITQSSEGSNDQTQKQGPNTPAIVGGVLGALAFLVLLAALFRWRRRQIFQRQPVGVLDNNNRYDGDDPVPAMGGNHQMANATSNEPVMAAGRVLPPAQGYPKATLARNQRRPLAPRSEYSEASSAQQLLSPTEESSVLPDTPPSPRSIIPPETMTHKPLYQAAPGEEPRRRSISARTLAQTLAPDLSERDIRRLADTIVARMHAGVSMATQGTPISATGVGSAIIDPPPPWRASWNSDTDDSRSHIA